MHGYSFQSRVGPAIRPFRHAQDSVHGGEDRQWLEGTPDAGNVAISRDWGWASDYVEAMWMMLQQNEPDDYVIATGEQHTLRDFVSMVFSELGLDPAEHVDSDPALLRPSDIEKSVGNSSKARAELGWKPKHRLPQIIEVLVDEERERQPDHLFWAKEHRPAISETVDLPSLIKIPLT